MSATHMYYYVGEGLSFLCLQVRIISYPKQVLTRGKEVRRIR